MSTPGNFDSSNNKGDGMISGEIVRSCASEIVRSCASEIVALSPHAPDNAVDVARRFQARVAELARSGTFGSLRTRKASLQAAYSLLLTLLDAPHVAFLIFGEEGTGKRRHVEEYLITQNFYNRLLGRKAGTLKIYRGDFCVSGFTAQFRSPMTSENDIIYLEAIDGLTVECQDELLEYLRARKKLATFNAGTIGPRIIAGTTRALSVMVLKDEFRRELFQALTAFALFLPSLNERAEDLPHLVQSLVFEESGKIQTPPVWLIDQLAQRLLPGNLDELRKLLKKGLAQKNTMLDWTVDFFESFTRPKFSAGFMRVEAPDYSNHMQERKDLKQALLRAGGDREAAAEALGLNKNEFLKKLLVHGLR